MREEDTKAAAERERTRLKLEREAHSAAEAERRETELARAAAEAEGRIRQERENEDVSRRRQEREAELRRKQISCVTRAPYLVALATACPLPWPPSAPVTVLSSPHPCVRRPLPSRQGVDRNRGRCRGRAGRPLRVQPHRRAARDSAAGRHVRSEGGHAHRRAGDRPPPQQAVPGQRDVPDRRRCRSGLRRRLRRCRLLPRPLRPCEAAGAERCGARGARDGSNPAVRTAPSASSLSLLPPSLPCLTLHPSAGSLAQRATPSATAPPSGTSFSSARRARARPWSRGASRSWCELAVWGRGSTLS